MLSNWVKESTSTTGTGLTLTLTGAVNTDRIKFSDTAPLLAEVMYQIDSGNDREQGIGILTSATTLDRTTPFVTLVGGIYDNSVPSRINVASGAVISIVAGASSYFPVRQPTPGLANQPIEGLNAGGLESDVALIVDLVFFIPSIFSTPSEVDAFAFNVVTLAAGSITRLGIFRMDGIDGATLIRDFGTISTATTGDKFITGLAQLVSPGPYYIGIVSDGVPVLRGTLLDSTPVFIGNTATDRIVFRFQFDVGSPAAGFATSYTGLTAGVGSMPKAWIEL